MQQSIGLSHQDRHIIQRLNNADLVVGRHDRNEKCFVI